VQKHQNIAVPAHIQEVLNEHLKMNFENLEMQLLSNLKLKKENKKKSYEYQKLRVEKIGIENIRVSKLKKLKEDYDLWIKEFENNFYIIPEVKQVLGVKING
jgi:hypothetical protein